MFLLADAVFVMFLWINTNLLLKSHIHWLISRDISTCPFLFQTSFYARLLCAAWQDQTLSSRTCKLTILGGLGFDIRVQTMDILARALSSLSNECFISVLSYVIALFVYFCHNLLEELLAVVSCWCFFTVCSVSQLFCQSQTTWCWIISMHCLLKYVMCIILLRK